MLLFENYNKVFKNTVYMTSHPQGLIFHFPVPKWTRVVSLISSRLVQACNIFNISNIRCYVQKFHDEEKKTAAEQGQIPVYRPTVASTVP